jgi:TatD DNase family protein
MLIDSHCHLDYFSAEEIPAMLARAEAAGVSQMITIGTRLSRAHEQLALAAAYSNVWCSVGTHPHHAAEENMPREQELAELAGGEKVVAIGESGLDYFYDRAPRDVQADSFRRHIQAARLAGVPVIIHTRDADDDMLTLLQEQRAAGGHFDFLLHCFSSGRPLAEAAIALGGYISFSGILTFPKSHDLKALAADLPADRLLVETDSPYLAPVPHRGKRNEPAFTAHTAAILANLRGLSPADLADLTTANFRRLFKKAS